MSEYQYYEFRAVDRPLDAADQAALRALSTRARITAHSFTNSYEWGDFKGDPAKLMERWFDLHIYWANWGARRLMLRLPARLADRALIEPFLRECECAKLRKAGDNLILDIRIDAEDSNHADDRMDGFDEDDETHRLTALAPLRDDVLGGDLRLFYLIWLMAVETGAYTPDEPEPLPGIGPLTPQLRAFAAFFGLNGDLVEAAAELRAPADESSMTAATARAAIAAMADADKTALLLRAYEGDALVGAELRARLRQRLAPAGGRPSASARTVGGLHARAADIAKGRKRAEAEKAAAEQRRRAEAEAAARRLRLDTLRKRGEGVWRDIEAGIALRSAKGYETAAGLLADLAAVADEQGASEAFAKRLQAIRERHSSKGKFLERLRDL